MTFDIIILSFSKTEKHKRITEKCIKSLRDAKNKIAVNIIVLESYNPSVRFEGTTTITFQQREFNYNKSMNHGFSLTKNKYVFFCNNDLQFYDGWADACYQAFAMGYKSLSPYCPVTTPRFNKDGNFLLVGHQVGFHIAGWCIGVERKMFEKLGGFNEAVRFWYSDNIYAEQLKLSNIKHVLVCNSFVKHLDFGSKTLNSLNRSEKAQLTSIQEKKYRQEIKKLRDAKKKEVLH